MEDIGHVEGKLKIGALVFDYQRHSVSLANRTLSLSPIEFDILAYLAEASPNVISHTELTNQLYDYEAEPEEAAAIVRTNIYRIRQKIAAVTKQKDLILTVRGVGYALQPPENRSDKELIDGRYRLAQRLGVGATSTVYLAYQESLDRPVAIKFLRDTLLESDNFRERFHREARHAANLQHPNIVQVYDFGQSTGSHYIVMEYIEGQTLQEKLEGLAQNNDHLSQTEILRILNETGLALAYAHQQGVIHRDVKLENIMIRDNGRVALMDFGLAKLVTAPHITAEGEISGTPNYMAPEHIQGGSIDTRVDIYAFGVLMYRLLTGRLPFIADTEIGVLFQHIKEAPPRPSLFNSELPPGIELTILKALSKEPDKRYHTFEDLLDDLNNPGKVTITFDDLQPTLEAPSTPPSYLPVPLTPFIRRAEEVNAVQSKLMQQEVRLLTLLGFGGVGKTRLALEIARNILSAFEDGVFFIDLTAVKMASLLPSTISHIIHMNESGSASAKEQLISYLQSRQVLLVMDNFEHILEATPLVNEILTAAPRCKVIATSREPLRLYGENLFRINPLPLPAHPQEMPYEDLGQFTAVQLFSERARAANSDFQLSPENIQQVATICIQLDGLPLALELAASQAYHYTPAEILEQLAARLSFLTDGPRDHSTRQQTMRGAIDWSYDLLDEREQQTFIRLAVFSGRFSAQAAAKIIGPVDLKRLVRKSLLQEEVSAGGQTRYVMLYLLAEYALEKLQADQTLPDLLQKHTSYYLDLAETAEPHLTGSDPTAWFEQLEEAHDNFRAVMHRSINNGPPEIALRLTSILWRLWAVYSYLSEGRLWLRQTLEATVNTISVDRAKAFYGEGRIALFQQNLTLSGQSFNESLLIFRQLGDEAGQAATLNSLGEIALQQENYEQARSLFDEALLLYRANQDNHGIVQSLTNLGHLALHKEQYGRANELLLESLDLEEKMGRPEATAIVLNGLGEVARIQERIPEATAYYKRALEIYRQLNYNIGQAVMLHNLGQLSLIKKNFQEALHLFRESLKLLRTMEEKVFVAWNLAGLGSAILNLGSVRHAVWLFSLSQTLLAVQDGRLDVLDQASYDHYLAESKNLLSAEEWQQAWQEGQTMPVESELLDIITLTPTLPHTIE